jgi:hypothetical protein
MVEYSLSLCYGIIVSDDKMEEFREVLTDEEYDEVMDNYSRCINCWIGGDYFIGIMSDLPESENDLVYRARTFSIPSNDDEELINFKRFFDEHDLWKLINWEPELLLINFCY